MATSIFIAKIIGPYFFLIGLSMLVNKMFFLKLMDDYSQNNIFVVFGGMFALVFGLVLLQVHNIWTASWPVVITIMGWSGVIKGVWLIIFPATVCSFMQFYIKRGSLLIIHGIFACVLGILLTVCGYCG